MQVAAYLFLFSFTPVEIVALIWMLADRWRPSRQADFNEFSKPRGLSFSRAPASLSDLPQHPDKDSSHSVLPQTRAVGGIVG